MRNLSLDSVGGILTYICVPAPLLPTCRLHSLDHMYSLVREPLVTCTLRRPKSFTLRLHRQSRCGFVILNPLAASSMVCNHSSDCEEMTHQSQVPQHSLASPHCNDCSVYVGIDGVRRGRRNPVQADINACFACRRTVCVIVEVCQLGSREVRRSSGVP
jgi:hypothetical protein